MKDLSYYKDIQCIVANMLQTNMSSRAFWVTKRKVKDYFSSNDFDLLAPSNGKRLTLSQEVGKVSRAAGQFARRNQVQ